MDLFKVNKIIAEYMGGEYVEVDNEQIQGTLCYFKEEGCYKSLDYYTSSLDALIPVWHKIEESNFFGGICIYSCIIGEKETFTVSSNLEVSHGGFEADSHPYDEGSDTIQQAAALATANAIQQLSDR